MDEKQNKKFFVYIIECVDKSYYVGSTSNLEKRVKQHNFGEAAEWTKKRRPVKIVYFEIYNSLIEARQREKQIKHWSRIKKENLINGIWKKKTKIK